jgi:hypothetical protein
MLEKPFQLWLLRASTFVFLVALTTHRITEKVHTKRKDTMQAKE